MAEYRAFSVTSDGKIECEITGADGEKRKLFSMSALAKTGNIKVDFKFPEPQVNNESSIFQSRSSGLFLKLALENGEDRIDLRAALTSDGAPTINNFLVNIDFEPGAGGVLDDCHVPHLTPEPGMVMGDMIFRSPAIIARKGDVAMALLPDLDKLGESRPAPWFMNFDRKGPGGLPRMSLGMMHYDPYYHVYFKGRPDEQIKIPDDGLELSANILFSAEADDIFSRRVLHFIWERYGVSNYHAVKPQVMSFDELGKEAMGRLFKRDDLYFEFDYADKNCSAVAAHAVTTEKKLKPLGALATKVMSPMHGIFILFYLEMMNRFGLSVKADDIVRRTLHSKGIPYIAEAQFMSWFNNMRTAYGARALAERWGDDEMTAQAERMKNLALSAPVEDGIFSCICTFPEGKVHWKRGTLSFKAIDDYHTPDQATTGYMMLRWYRDIAADPALLDMARGLGKYFLKHQRETGAVPAWIEGRTHRHMDRLIDTASTAGPMMFMAMLAKTDGDEAALESAKKMAAFIEREVIPEHKWYDYETFYSCSRQRKPPRDPRTGVLPHNTMSTLWAAEGARLIYELTSDKRYLELLLKCLDGLLFHQQAWNAGHLSINTFGGFSCMNTDAEWNDARQGIIAPVLMDSYIATGDPQYFQRGVAALRSCYTTMLHPALEEVAPGNMVHYRESDRGAVYENYAHIGVDRVIAGYLEPDWGAGTAAFATAHAMKFYGDIFVDLKIGHAFGINGVDVIKFDMEGPKISIEVESRVPGPADPKVVVRGAGPGTCLIVNGDAANFSNMTL